MTGPQDKVKEMDKEFAQRRDYIYGRLKDLPHISVIEPKGAFYTFVKVEDTFGMEYKGEKVGDVSRLAAILLEDYSVAVVPCTDFGSRAISVYRMLFPRSRSKRELTGLRSS